MSKIILAVASLLVPAAALAQAPTPKELSSVIRPGDEVIITTDDGRAQRGRFTGIRPTGALLTVGRRRPVVLPVERIRRVELFEPDPISDSVKRGFWIGLGVGGGVGTLVLLTLCEGFGDCLGGFASAGILAGIGGGIGALSGAIGDAALVDKRVVWPVRAVQPPPFAVGVIAGARRAGVRLTLRW